MKKLTKLTRAVGDLIVNLYLRCYLCQMGMECEINLVLYNYFRENFDEFMITLNSVSLICDHSQCTGKRGKGVSSCEGERSTKFVYL